MLRSSTSILGVLMSLIAWSQGDPVVISPSPVLCSSLTPVVNISLEDFEGYWSLASIYEFENGSSIASEPESSNECNWYLFENATDNTMDEMMEEYIPGSIPARPDVYHSHLFISDGAPGRWHFKDSLPEELDEEELTTVNEALTNYIDEDEENRVAEEEEEEENETAEESAIDDMVVVAADPSLFIVSVNCIPIGSSDDKEQDYVKGVSVLIRREGRHGPLAFPLENLKDLEKVAVAAVGFVPVEPHIRQKTEC